MMRKYRFILLLLGFLSTFSLSASADPSPGSVRFSGEWLYLFLAVDQPNFIIDSRDSEEPIGPRVANDQGWHSGYRVNGTYSFCDSLSDFTVRWTHFPSLSEHKYRSGALLMPIITYPPNTSISRPGEATIKDTYNSAFIDLLFSRKIIHQHGFGLSLLGGIQLGYLGLFEEITHPEFASLIHTITTHSRLRGAGLEVGISGLYNFWNCFSLVSSLHRSWLYSEMANNTEITYNDGTIDVKVESDPYWRLTPTTEFRLGLSYTRPLNFSSFIGDWGCFNLNVELGYELFIVQEGVERLLFVDDANLGSSFNEEMDLSLNGPYLHIGLSY